MKKRILSAVLALAMALTLLPMSVFAAAATPPKPTETAPVSGQTQVQYVYGTDYSKPTKSANSAGEKFVKDAWTWQWTDTSVTPNVTYWANSTTLDGFVSGTSASGTWYASSNPSGVSNGDSQSPFNTNGTLKTTSFTLVDSSFTVTEAMIKGDGTNNTNNVSASFSINTFGKTLDMTGGAVMNRVTSLTITDTWASQYGGTAGTVSGLQRDVHNYTVPASGAAATMSTSGLTLSITNAKVTGGINLSGRGNRVTLTEVDVADGINLSGDTTVTNNGASSTKTYSYDSQQLTINAKAAAPYTKSKVTSVISGSQNMIRVIGNNCTVNLNGVDVGSGNGQVAVIGNGGTFTVGNGSTVGKVVVTTCQNSLKKDADAPAAVTVDGTVGGVIFDNIQKTTGASSFTLNANSKATGEIKTPNGTVTLHSANVQNVTVEAGTLTIDGSGGSAGDITLGRGTGTTATKVAFNFSATNYKGDKITKAHDDTVLTIGSSWPAGRSNTFGVVDLKNYTGQGIKGGIFDIRAADSKTAAWFSPDLQFTRRTTSNGSTYAYYGKRELATAIADAGDLAKGTKDGAYISVIGSAVSHIVEFYNSMMDINDSTKAVAKIAYGDSTGIYLPDKINGTPVATWTDASAVVAGTAGSAKTYGVNELVSLSSAVAAPIRFVIQSSGAAVTRLTNVQTTGNNKDVTATLSGNTITLSGAVGQAAFEDVTVTCGTDLMGTDGKPVTFNVTASYDTTAKTAVFSTAGLTPPPQGVTVNSNTIVVGNNTYTLNVSGLTKPASSLMVAGFTSGVYANTTSLPGTSIEVTVNASMGNTAKQDLIDALTSSNAKFDWTNSPAMRQVVNQAMTTITTNNQIDSWATAAQRAAWNLNNKGKTPTDGDLLKTGYTKVVLQPYLAVTVTAFNQSGTMTANLVPSYRVLVVSDSTTYTGTNGIANGKTNFTKEGYYIAQAGRALANPITDLTDENGDNGVEIVFDGTTTTGMDTNTFMHQDSTYAYKPTAAGSYLLTRAGKTGLGTVVFNTTAPLVELERATGAKNVTNGKVGTYYYDNLQAAVNDTLPQADADKQDKITVTAAYTGSGTIDVTGTARTFTVETKGQTTISNANNNFTVGVGSDGHTYTVQLTKSVAAPSQEVEVAVNTAANGYATVSSSKVKAGDTVTITPSASTGYRVSGVSATTNTGASVPVTANANGTYSFVVPAGVTKVTVTPTFVKTNTSTLPFEDVSTTDSFYNAVKWNYDNNYVKGTTATKFAPYSAITRGQIVLILYRNYGSPAVTISNRYTDMPTAYDQEMARAITWATNVGIVNGYGDGRFGPNNNVRKQELAKILYLYNQVRNRSTAGTADLNALFTDAGQISSWARPYVQWAVANGIMSGSGGTFGPQTMPVRHQVATYVYNYGLKYGA